uniref:Centrosomal protein 170Ab n=1 Tax=Hucho hucho TaxID=62062 RepID=A0A4W5L435_9TELE
MSVSSWFLVSGGGMRHRLPWEMIFVGRDDCELMLQSRSVDKQHAVINYEPTTDEHKVKDLGSLNGTFVNDVRIQEQLHVPEEALKVGNTISVQNKIPVFLTDLVDGVVSFPGDIAVLKRGTPLYGQPSWWGDGDADDENSGKQDGTTTDKKQERSESGRCNGKDPKETTAEAQENGLYTSSQEPSYFEIPSYTNEPPSQDTEGTTAAKPATGPEAVPQGHASFTIEFDLQASNKVTVKDRVTKVAPEVRPRPPKKGAGEELSALQTAMVAAEVKVADWLAQNEIPLARTESVDRVVEDDGESVKSDVPVQLKSLKGSKHEDGTQSDSENSAALGEQRRAALEDHSRGLWGGRLEGSGVKIREGRANVPEGLFAEEDSPSRRHRSSASKMAPIGGELRERERTKDSVPYHRDQHQPIGLGEGFQNRHGDDYSDRGTYTIEIENEDNQEVEARRMIDKVGMANRTLMSLNCHLNPSLPFMLGTGCCSISVSPLFVLQSLPEELVVGGPRWVSQWATLAASHIRTDPEGSGAENNYVFCIPCLSIAEISESSHSASMASSSYTERKRRTLPQLPSTEEATPGGRRSPGPAHRPSDVGEKQDTELQEKENQEMGRGGRTKPGGGGGVGSQAGSVETVLAKLPPRPVSSGGKRLEEARRRKKEMEEKAKERESAGKPLLRQESFTVERPSTNVPQELIPRIDTQTGARIPTKEGWVDSTTRQKDSEAVAALMETTVSDLGEPISQSIEGSLSPESDVDTTSTVSQAAGVGGRKVVHQKRRTLAAQQKEREKTVLCSSTKGPTRARDTQDRKPKSRPSGGQGTRQAGRAWTSLDLTDDDVNSNSLLSDSQPSIQEVSSHSSHARTQAGSTRVEASTKASRAKNTQASSTTTNTLSKPTTTLPKVRPTRASILRRARLGDSSDTEPADMDRMSVASEASTASSRSTAPGPGIRRGLSRIEALAQPRKPRVGSPSAQSDSEATGGRSRGIGARSIATDYAVRQGLRGVSNMGGIIPRARANSASKLPDKSKGYITPTGNSGGRWRRMPMDYASTSEDEFGSNRHPSKHGGPARQFASPRLTQLGGSAPATPSLGGIAALRQQSAGREQEEYMKDWTTHSEEIARYGGAVCTVHIERYCRVNYIGEPPLFLVVSPQAVLDSLLLASVTQLCARIRHSVDKTAGKIRILFKDKDRKWDEIENKLQAEHDSLLLKTSSTVRSSEQLVAGFCEVLDDAVGLPQAPFPVDVLDGWEHGPSDVLGQLHHPLEGLAFIDRAIPVPGCDANGQDALNGAREVPGKNLNTNQRVLIWGDDATKLWDSK